MTRVRSTPSEAGHRAEEAALEFLRRQGLQLLTRNFRCRGGEVDLVMRDGASLVFVEVRFRRSRRFGGAAASVDGRKQGRLILAAKWYLLKVVGDPPCRFDVVAVEPDGDTLRFDWLKNAFEAT